MEFREPENVQEKSQLFIGIGIIMKNFMEGGGLLQNAKIQNF